MRRFFLLLLLLVVPAGAARSWDYFRTSLIYPNRFAEVVPGELYRGGTPSADHVARLSEEKSIKTILSLTDETKRPEETAALQAMRNRKIKFVRVPMPGDGTGTFEAMDKAADVIAESRNWPMFYHCAAGKQRSNAATAAYLLKIKGWPLETTLKELEQKYDLDPVEEKKLYDHIKAYDEHLKEMKTPVSQPETQS